MSKLSNDPTRKKFIKRDGYAIWECKDFKTFYMTIRKQALPLDEKKNRDPNKYILYMSSAEILRFLTEIFDDIETPELAMQKGYERANFLYSERLKSKPNKL